MRVMETNVYKFDELSDSAKETAINECREFNVNDSFWYEYIFDDTKEIAEIIGIEIDDIYFSGFWSQGDGAMWLGSYSYKAKSTKAIRDYAPQDTDLHEIADSLAAIQKLNFYQLNASITKNHYAGNYSHSGVMYVSVERDSSNYQEMSNDAESDITDNLRYFADWIYKRLESEYRYATSDETVTESILANEYEFDVSGNMI